MEDAKLSMRTDNGCSTRPELVRIVDEIKRHQSLMRESLDRIQANLNAIHNVPHQDYAPTNRKSASDKPCFVEQMDMLLEDQRVFVDQLRSISGTLTSLTGDVVKQRIN